MLPSVLPKLGTDSAVRRFPGVWKLLFLRLPSQDRIPSTIWGLYPIHSLLKSSQGVPSAVVVAADC